MIKEIKKIYQSYMTRPIIYQSVTKLSVALVIVLAWNQFINKSMELVRDGFFIMGAFFFVPAWFQYLKLDGMKVHHMFEDREQKKNKKKKIHFTKDIVDFADEKIISFDELDDAEKTVCRLIGDIACGLIFIIPAIVHLLL